MQNMQYGDPLGDALMKYSLTGDNPIIQVHSREVESYDLPVSLLFREYDQMPVVEQQALKACRGKILDIGAGAGCHTQYLQQQKFDVEALDISFKACRVMQQKGIQAVHNEDIFRFTRNAPYDTLLMLMNGVGLCGTLEKLKILLHHCKKLLKSNGQIIFDTSDIIYLYEAEPYDLNAGKYYGEVTYEMVYENIRSGWFEWLYVDYETLFEIAGEAGYFCEMIYRGEHYDYLVRLTNQS